MNNKILIVEDNALFYNNLARHLQENGFEILPYAPSYEDAIESIQRHQPAIALLDIDLKGDKSGYDVARFLHARTNIPFIFLTRYDDSLHFNQTMPVSPEDYLTKDEYSRNPASLIRKLILLLNRRVYHSGSAASRPEKIGLMVVPDYLEELHEKSLAENKLIKLPFEDIVVITKDAALIRRRRKTKRKENYVMVIDKNDRDYFVKYSLNDLKSRLPQFLQRINDKYIVNILADEVEILKNKKFVKINGNTQPVNKTYQEAFKEAVNQYFLPHKSR